MGHNKYILWRFYCERASVPNDISLQQQQNTITKNHRLHQIRRSCVNFLDRKRSNCFCCTQEMSQFILRPRTPVKNSWDFWLRPRTREYVGWAVGTLGLGSLLVNFLPQTFFIEQYKNFLQAYRYVYNDVQSSMDIYLSWADITAITDWACHAKCQKTFRIVLTKPLNWSILKSMNGILLNRSWCPVSMLPIWVSFYHGCKYHAGLMLEFGIF